MKFLALMLIWGLAILPAAAQQLPPVTDDNYLIVPGERIGPARLGDSVMNVIAVLGPPVIYDIAPAESGRPAVQEFGWPLLESGHPGLNPNPEPSNSLRFLDINAISTHEQSPPQAKIVRVVIAGDPHYATADGLHAGSTEQEVREKLGGPTKMETKVREKLVAPTKTETHGAIPKYRERYFVYALGIIFIMSDQGGDALFRVTMIEVISPRCFEPTPPLDLCTVVVG